MFSVGTIFSTLMRSMNCIMWVILGSDIRGHMFVLKAQR